MRKIKDLENYLSSHQGQIGINIVRLCEEYNIEPWKGNADWVTLGKTLGMSNDAVRNRYRRFTDRLEGFDFTVGKLLDYLDDKEVFLEDLKVKEIFEKKRVKQSTWTMPDGSSGESEKVAYQAKLPDDITPEYLLSQAGLDYNDFEIGKVVVSNWADDQRSVRAEFIRRELPTEDTLQQLQAALKSINIPQRKPTTLLKRTNSDITAVVSLYDLHIGKIGKDQWGYDPTFLDHILEALAYKIRVVNPDIIVLPWGNDLLNSDNRFGTTERGTPQQSIGYSKMITVAAEFSCRVGDLCAMYCPKVYVKPVPGNHDPFSVHWLAQVMKQRYRLDNTVQVDNASDFHFYDEENLSIMFTHKKKPHLIQTFAKYNPVGFTKPTKEIHIGHTHEEALEMIGGVPLRTLPALTDQDDWHYDNGYASVKLGSILKYRAGYLDGIEYIR